MLTRQRLANPSVVRQAPDNKAIQHSTQLVVGSQQLTTPPIAQEYFEPGINTKLTRRAKPKTNYTLPSDLPKYPLGFVPTNQTPGANGEEPAQVVVKEAVPADLLSMFKTISAQQAAESRAVEEAKVAGRMDVGTVVAQQYQAVLTEKQTEARSEKMMKSGFTEEETATALRMSKMERAVEAAKEAVPSAVVSVEAALEEKFPRKAEPEKPKPTYEEVAQFKAIEEKRKMEQDVAKIRERERIKSELEEGKALEKRGKERMKELLKGKLPNF